MTLDTEEEGVLAKILVNRTRPIDLLVAGRAHRFRCQITQQM